MIEIVVYLDNEYKVNKSIYVTFDLSKEEITNKIVENFGNDWYSYDIINCYEK